MRTGKKMTPAMKLALLRVEQALKKREQAQRVWDEACLAKMGPLERITMGYYPHGKERVIVNG